MRVVIACGRLHGDRDDMRMRWHAVARSSLAPPFDAPRVVSLTLPTLFVGCSRGERACRTPERDEAQDIDRDFPRQDVAQGPIAVFAEADLRISADGKTDGA
jgi:hypothetical protein